MREGPEPSQLLQDRSNAHLVFRLASYTSTFEDLIAALAAPGLAAVTVMRAAPEVTAAAIATVRRHFAGPVGAYAETGQWAPPHWVFTGPTPQQYLAEARTWASHGAQLIGGCCGTNPSTSPSSPHTSPARHHNQMTARVH